MDKYSQKTFAGKVYQTIRKNGLIKAGDKVVVALSGGADSVALLYALILLREKLGISILACHFNHRLRSKESERDEKFVKDLCDRLTLECIIGRAEKQNLYRSEDEARKARYCFFEKILKEGRGDSVAIAHNLNDQAETVLMRLIRGTGIRGLQSIPYKRKNFIRPLLDIPRKEVEIYLRKEGLSFVTDRTNLEPNYLRNEIRANLLPYLSKLNPNILETLANVSKNVAADYDFIKQTADKELERIICYSKENEIAIDYKAWLNLHPALRANTLRIGLSTLGTLDDVTVKHLDEVLSVLEKGAGRKFKRLPHSLRIELLNGKIVLSKN